MALVLLDSTTMPQGEVIVARATTDKPAPVGERAKMQLVPPDSAASAVTLMGMEAIPKILAKKVGAVLVTVACTKKLLPAWGSPAAGGGVRVPVTPFEPFVKLFFVAAAWPAAFQSP